MLAEPAPVVVSSQYSAKEGVDSTLVSACRQTLTQDRQLVENKNTFAILVSFFPQNAEQNKNQSKSSCPRSRISKNVSMKIFVSHSSRDRWIARRISQDLVALGATTFLDEKDIETGASIDDEIGKHLRECDELLLLLSPTALQSHWVLIEVGGAKALGKRLVPILLHIGANEMPAPISKHLARDVNEIEKYYDEVGQRIVGHAVPARAPEPRPRRIRRPPRTFIVGSKVRIVPARPSAVERPEYFISWTADMDAFLGKIATAAVIDRDNSMRLDIDQGYHWWAFEWVSPAEQAE